LRYIIGIMEPDNAEIKPESSSFGKSVWEWVKVIIIALAISLPVRFFIAEPFVVNGASMDPTFATGQFLIVDRLTYRLESPKRGDVIVFEYPENPSVYYIKRIIGLPTETVNLKDGIVSITTASTTTTAPQTTTLNEPYIADIHASHDTFHVVLGKSEYFVMGDNRAQSSDSRVWGPLDTRFIIGRPIVRLFPLNTLSILPGKENQ